MNRRLIILAVAILLVAAGRSFSDEPDLTKATIRVAIMQDIQSLNIRISGGYEIFDIRRNLVSRGHGLTTIVTCSSNDIVIGQHIYASAKVRIRASDSGVIVIDGRKFRGDIEFVRREPACLLVINEIDLEDYVKGILYHEASHYWPMEALKAQAIVCRTYALYQIGENKTRDYDVTSDIYSQVYGGKTSERYRTSRAVEETAGLILEYRGKVLPAYFHSTCGGHTEDASLLWGKSIPPLAGVVCPFCKESPHFNWHAVIPLSEIAEKLTLAGFRDLKVIKDITASSPDPSGRRLNVRIVTDKKVVTIPAKDFRNAVGPNIIKSTRFSLQLNGDDMVFEGSGWGHGAGLCQWGAYFMAKHGYNYKEILNFYYPLSYVKSL